MSLELVYYASSELNSPTASAQVAEGVLGVIDNVLTSVQDGNKDNEVCLIEVLFLVFLWYFFCHFDNICTR